MPDDGDKSRNEPRHRQRRFTARPRKESETGLHENRVRQTLDDMAGLYNEAQQIVDEGPDAFFAAENLRTRRAATAIIIHLSDAAHRPEIDSMRTHYPDVDWQGLRGQRNWLSHKYDDIDFNAVWRTISEVFPRERILLGLDPHR